MTASERAMEAAERCAESCRDRFIGVRDVALALDAFSAAETGRLRSALQGVIGVADRKTVEFDAARAALEGRSAKGGA